MTIRQQESTYITIISIAAQRTGLSPQMVQECLARQLVREPLTQAELAELRRIRRLQELGVNLAGIEIILHMRRRIQALQHELNRRERGWDWSSWIDLEEPWPRLLPWLRE